LRVNVAEALGEGPAIALESRVKKLAEAAQPPRPIHIDGRLHHWEWLKLRDGSLLKADAVDHSRQHDLIGCQDAAWDVAGARLEFDLDPAETDALVAEIDERLSGSIDRNLLAVFAACYPAFQLGLWQSDAAASAEDARLVAAHAERYRNALLELAA
jgi:hypothetical protein